MLRLVHAGNAVSTYAAPSGESFPIGLVKCILTRISLHVPYYTALARFGAASSTWSKSDLSPDDEKCSALVVLRSLPEDFLNRSVHLKQLLRRPVQDVKPSEVLPLVHASVKSKCFAEPSSDPLPLHLQGSPLVEAFKHSCSKPEHQCCRVLCSAARLPAKGLWRSLSRAWQSIIQEDGRTFEVWVMRDATGVLLRRRSKLFHPPPHVPCARCGGPRPEGGPSIITADATQFYEQVKPISVQNAMLSLAAARGRHSTVSVYRTKKCRVWLKPGLARSPSLEKWEVATIQDALGRYITINSALFASHPREGPSDRQFSV